MFRLFLLGALALLPAAVSAQTEEHIVAPSEIQQEIVAASESRKANLSQIDHFLQSERVDKVLKTAKIDGNQIRQAVPLLSDEEVTRLASTTVQLEKDFTAGALSNQEITYILIALVTAVVILVIVAA